MKLKIIKFRDILSERIKEFGGEKAPPAKYGEIEIWLGEIPLKIKSVSGGKIISHVMIEVEEYKSKGGKNGR